jgi:hypothetical protein
VRDLTRLELVTEAVRLGKNPTRPKTKMNDAGAAARQLLEHLAVNLTRTLVTLRRGRQDGAIDGMNSGHQLGRQATVPSFHAALVGFLLRAPYPAKSMPTFD